MTGHFTSYETRTDHELATRTDRNLDDLRCFVTTTNVTG
jgi:hypothetical protein